MSIIEPAKYLKLLTNVVFCYRKPDPPKQQQSHIMDLLDISLGATSISSPPHTDPWGMGAPPPRPHVIFVNC